MNIKMKKIKLKKQDKFLKEAQKIKMKELWNNKEDEIWEKILNT